MATVLKTLMSVIFVLSMVSVVGFRTLYYIAPRLSEIVFGEKYEIAGEYIRWPCVMYAVRLVATSFDGVYTVFKRQNFELFLNVLLIISARSSYLLCSLFKCDVFRYSNPMSMGYTIVYLLILGGYIVVCKNYDKNIGSEE